MRHRRSLAPWARNPESGKSATYHCVSRVVGREFLLNDEAKEYFCQIVRLYERFTGVRVLAHCCMSNHFHLLLEVPSRAELKLSDGELLARLGLLYSDVFVAEVSGRLAELRETGQAAEAEAYRETFLRRMHDLSEFMKVVKQRMTGFVNRHHQRKGTLWEERFKSVLVESGHACRVMAAYIDLNPVRAGLVQKPEGYRWSSYGEACAGSKGSQTQAAQTGLARVMAKHAGDWTANGKPQERLPWKEARADYRKYLFADGEQRGPAEGGRIRKGISGKGVEQVKERKGQMTRAELLRCRVRHFSQGVVLGRQEFVEGIFEETREFYAPSRRGKEKGSVREL